MPTRSIERRSVQGPTWSCLSGFAIGLDRRRMNDECKRRGISQRKSWDRWNNGRREPPGINWPASFLTSAYCTAGVHRQLNRRNVRMIDRWRRQAEALFYAVDSSAYHRGSLVAFAFADIRPVKRVHFWWHLNKVPPSLPLRYLGILLFSTLNHTNRQLKQDNVLVSDVGMLDVDPGYSLDRQPKSSAHNRIKLDKAWGLLTL